MWGFLSPWRSPYAVIGKDLGGQSVSHSGTYRNSRGAGLWCRLLA